MDGLEESLNGLLSDPAAMERFRQLAGVLAGSMGANMGGPAPEGPSAPEGSGPGLPEGRLSELLGRLMGAYGEASEAAKLVAALGPLLQPARRERLEKALRVARFVRAARAVLPDLLPQGPLPGG